MNRVLVCGSRYTTDWPFVRDNLDRIICFEKKWITEKDEYGNYLPLVHIISGGAKGVDTLAIDWAIVNWQSFTEYPANWDKYGKSAGYIRNSQMLKEGKPNLVIAFPGGKGTANMVELAEKAEIEIIRVYNGKTN